LLIKELKRISGSGTIINENEVKASFSIDHYSKGDHFIREGEIPDKIGFIVKGLMKYYYIDAEGNEWIKHFSSENDFAASYAGFLYRFPSPYFIEAMEETTMLSIVYASYSANVAASLAWCNVARKFTEKIYMEKERREASLLKEDGAGRYKSFLSQYKHLKDRISIKDIASFLGLTPVSLSRIRAKIIK